MDRLNPFSMDAGDATSSCEIPPVFVNSAVSEVVHFSPFASSQLVSSRCEAP